MASVSTHETKLREYIATYNKTPSDALLLALFVESLPVISYWTRHAYVVSKRNYDALEIALDFVVLVKNKSLIDSPFMTIRALVYQRTTKYRKIKYFTEQFVPEVYDPDDPDFLIIMEEGMKRLLRGLEPHIAGAAVYLINYPDEMDRIFSFYKDDLVSLFLILNRYYEVRKLLMNESYEIKDLVLTKSTKILVLSALYNQSPELFVLFLLFKDVGKFLQFCALFSDKTIKIPDFDNILEVIVKANDISTSLDNRQALRISEVEDLLNLTSDSNYNVNPVISDFLPRILESIANKYEESLEKLVKSVDSDTAERIYTVLNKEYAAQSNLLGSILSSMESAEALKSLTSSKPDTTP